MRRRFFRRADGRDLDEVRTQPAQLVGRGVFGRLLSNALGLSSRLPGEIDAAEQVASSGRMAAHAA